MFAIKSWNIFFLFKLHFALTCNKKTILLDVLHKIWCGRDVRSFLYMQKAKTGARLSICSVWFESLLFVDKELTVWQLIHWSGCNNSFCCGFMAEGFLQVLQLKWYKTTQYPVWMGFLWIRIYFVKLPKHVVQIKRGFMKGIAKKIDPIKTLNVSLEMPKLMM